MKDENTPLTALMVINSLPEGWVNIEERMKEHRALLKNKWVSMLIDTSEMSVSLTIFVAEQGVNKSKSIVVSKMALLSNEASEIIDELTPLVDEWNVEAEQLKSKEVNKREAFEQIVSFAKQEKLSVIPSMSENRLRFNNDLHRGEISEGVEGEFNILIANLSAIKLMEVIRLLSGEKEK